MGLITSNAETTLAAVRALSECALTAPLRKNITIPWVPFTAPVPKAAEAWEDSLTRVRSCPVRGRQHNVRETIEAWRATDPGRFTVRDYAAFAGIPVLIASGQLPKYEDNGTLKRVGKKARAVVWQFTR